MRRCVVRPVVAAGEPKLPWANKLAVARRPRRYMNGIREKRKMLPVKLFEAATSNLGWPAGRRGGYHLPQSPNMLESSRRNRFPVEDLEQVRCLVR